MTCLRGPTQGRHLGVLGLVSGSHRYSPSRFRPQWARQFVVDSVAGKPARAIAEVEDRWRREDFARWFPHRLYEAAEHSVGARDLVDGLARRVSLQDSDGGKPVRFEDITWSPTGSRIVVQLCALRGSQIEISVKSCDLAAKARRPSSKTTVVRFTWLPSGRLIYSRSAKRGAPSQIICGK